MHKKWFMIMRYMLYHRNLWQEHLQKVETQIRTNDKIIYLLINTSFACIYNFVEVFCNEYKVSFIITIVRKTSLTLRRMTLANQLLKVDMYFLFLRKNYVIIDFSLSLVLFSIMELIICQSNSGLCEQTLFVLSLSWWKEF